MLLGSGGRKDGRVLSSPYRGDIWHCNASKGGVSHNCLHRWLNQGLAVNYCSLKARARDMCGATWTAGEVITETDFSTIHQDIDKTLLSLASSSNALHEFELQGIAIYHTDFIGHVPWDELSWDPQSWGNLSCSLPEMSIDRTGTVIHESLHWLYEYTPWDENCTCSQARKLAEGIDKQDCNC